MPRASEPSRVFEPGHLPDLLSMYHDHPEAIVVAGGTYLMSKDRGARFPELPKVLLSLRQIAELKRISRSERYFDIGAAASITSVLNTGAKIAPAILLKALRSIGFQPLRNQATLGGNISVPEIRLSAFPVLLLLDAKVELRKLNHTRWISLSRFVGSDGTLEKVPGELCSRIRVPLGEWNVHEYRSIAPAMKPSAWNISFCGIADTRKGVLSDMRFAFGSMGKTILRSREIEAELISRKLPLGKRDRESATEQLRLTMEALTPGLTDVQKNIALRYLDWFLNRLNID